MNRNGLVVDVAITQATGTAEREAALDMLEQVSVSRRITVGADKVYDTANFVTMCRRMNITPHVALRQWSKVDGRTTRHAGYLSSQRIRKRVEEIFGWVKTVAGGSQAEVQRSRTQPTLVGTYGCGLQPGENG